MTAIFSVRLYEPVQAHKALADAWTKVKPWIIGGHRLVLTISTETRSDKQNRLLHAMLGDIAEQMEWAGKRRDIEVWKRLLTAAWMRARNEHIELLPALDGVGADIVFRRTSQLTRSECAELCDYIAAWCADNGVELREAQQWQM